MVYDDDRGKFVAPLVGARIEIACIKHLAAVNEVAPLVGAWIEIDDVMNFSVAVLVAPLVGAWIEISQASGYFSFKARYSSCKRTLFMAVMRHFMRSHRNMKGLVKSTVCHIL